MIIENSHQIYISKTWRFFGIPRTVDHDGEFINSFVLDLSSFHYLFVSRLSPFRFRHLPCCPLCNFTQCGSMQNGTGWRSASIWGFPAQLPRLEMLVTCSSWMWATSVLGPCPVGPIWFYCGTMQNGTGWKSALIWGFLAQLPSLEKPVTY